MYEIKQDFINYNRSGETLNAIGAVLHETANPGDTDEGEQKYFDSGNRQASAHTFIDWDSITQCIPWNEVAWGAGPTANHKFYQIEMCHTSDPILFKEIWERTVWLFAYLWKQKGWSLVTQDNLLSHAQVSATWHETDHTDPIDYLAKFGLDMQMFRDAVQKCINTGVIDNLQIGGSVMVVKKGSTGQAVTDLQKKLNTLGYNLVVDGNFGDATETAVKDFQQKNKLVIDGVVGPITMDVLNKQRDDFQVLQDAGIISSPDYWKTNAIVGGAVKGEYAAQLIKNMANKLRG